MYVSLGKTPKPQEPGRTTIYDVSKNVQVCIVYLCSLRHLENVGYFCSVTSMRRCKSPGHMTHGDEGQHEKAHETRQIHSPSTVSSVQTQSLARLPQRSQRANRGRSTRPLAQTCSVRNLGLAACRAVRPVHVKATVMSSCTLFFGSGSTNSSRSELMMSQVPPIFPRPHEACRRSPPSPPSV